MKDNLKKRPEDYILTQPDPEKFRCKNCNYSGFNRTGMKPRGYCGASTISMWGSPCDKCIDGWKEIKDGGL